jgi:hypothetical protein
MEQGLREGMSVRGRSYVLNRLAVFVERFPAGWTLKTRTGETPCHEREREKDGGVGERGHYDSPGAAPSG